MRVLLIEDDANTAKATQLALTQEGFDVRIAECGGLGIELARRGRFDAIVLDLHLPDISGFDVVRTLRAAKVHTPILILSGDATIDARVTLLRLGADDFLLKPYFKGELAARLRAIVRRASATTAAKISIGALVIDMASKTVQATSAALKLTGTEYTMLEFFALRKGAVLSKSALMAHLYGGMDEPDSKIIDVFICKLRKKLAEGTGGKDYIHTVWGAGYQFLEPA